MNKGGFMNDMSFGFDSTSHWEQEDIEASHFLTKNYHIYASGRFETIRLPAVDQQQLLDLINTTFHRIAQDNDSNPVVIGAIPFDTTQRSMLHFYRQHQKQNTASFTQFKHQQQYPSFKLHSQKGLVSKQQFAKAIDQALVQFDQNNLEKIVLSQAVDFELSHQQSPYDLVHTLADQNKHAFSFVIPVEDNAHLLGVSPELLISKQGHIVKSNPLAGSRPLSEDNRINQKHIDDLYASKKDLHEHQIVVDSVFENLKPFCEKLSVSEQPEILKTTTMLHLSTVFEGQLKNAQTNALALALSLHPTPAICGSPTQLSKKFILEHEGYDRHYFAGLVGWMDAEGNGEWAVTIRCGLLSERNLRLYAGAGIVKGSEAEFEWNETEAKMQTLLKALNLV